MNKISEELLRIVSEDLEYIIKKWNANDISIENLRRSSDVLRRFFIYREIYKVAEFFRKELKILDSNEEAPFSSECLSYQAGGGKVNGMHIKEVRVFDKALSPEDIKDLYNEGKKIKTNQSIYKNL